ncbi:MAG: S-layer homology domain-containing protein [Nostocaceae cyanobacterium]|nr:S-layer homology domain-containing protein [Nostocaceae cyanobacterium]
MTNTPPTDPRSRRSPLGFDEFIAILVAFGFIGSLLFWILGKKPQGFDFSNPWSATPAPTFLPNADGNATVGASPAPATGVEATPQATVTPGVVPTPQATVTPGVAATPVVVVPAPPRVTAPPVIAPAPQTPGATNLVPVAPVPTTTATPGFPASPNAVTTPPVAQPTASPSPTPVVSPTPTPTPTQQTAPTGVVPLPPLATTRQPLKFVDVPNGFWASPFIDALSARGVIQGFEGNNFRPNQPVTRAEFAALLQKAFDNQSGDKAVEYKDLKPNFWANPAIDRATKIGFLRGYPGQIFQPQQRIPRVQALVALTSGLNLQPTAPTNQVLGIYKDGKNIPKYALDKIAAATQNGIVVNYPNPDVLNPNRNITRAEAAAIVYQALVKAGRVQPIQSSSIVKPRQ